MPYIKYIGIFELILNFLASKLRSFTIALKYRWIFDHDIFIPIGIITELYVLHTWLHCKNPPKRTLFSLIGLKNFMVNDDTYNWILFAKIKIYSLVENKFVNKYKLTVITYFLSHIELNKNNKLLFNLCSTVFNTWK